MEESFQAGKGLAGLDEHQVRRWCSSQRWTLLAVIAAHERSDCLAPAGLIALTCNEVRALFTTLIIEPSCALAYHTPGQTGDDATNTAHAPSHYQRQEKPPTHGHNDLPLEH